MGRAALKPLKIRYTKNMDRTEKSGYLEVAHTADWELKVWGEDMPELMKQAAKGMYALAGTKFGDCKPEKRGFKVSLSDCESALVDFLSELVFYGEHEGIGFDHFDIERSEKSFSIHASVRPILEQMKEIKAVTYHNMNIKETESGLEVNIVFDV